MKKAMIIRNAVWLVCILMWCNVMCEAKKINPCDQRLKDGKECYDKGQWEEALFFFDRAQKEGCNNANYVLYIENCNLKMEKGAGKTGNSVVDSATYVVDSVAYAVNCEDIIRQGEARFNQGDYSSAKETFNQGIADCDGVQSRIDKCNAKIAEMNAILSLSLTDIEFEAFGGTKTITVSTNISSWSYSSASSWLLVSKNGSVLTVICNPNTVATERSSSLTVKAGDKTAKINIKQQGAIIDLDMKEARRLIDWNINSAPTDSNDGLYKGGMNKNVFNGLGVKQYSNKNLYFGAFTNNARNGKAIYFVPDGYSIPNCDKCKFYVGDYQNGKKQGKGTCYDKTGKVIYYGNFANDKPLDTYPSIQSYSAYKFQVIDYPNSGKYLGETKNGKQDGYGIYLWNEGGMWYGQWEAGKREGNGILIELDGDITIGTWNGDAHK